MELSLPVCLLSLNWLNNILAGWEVGEDGLLRTVFVGHLDLTMGVLSKYCPHLGE